jgi:hypothetical protein
MEIDYVRVYQQSPAAVSPANALPLRLSPNPAHDYFRVSFPQPATRLDLMDNTGRVVRTVSNPAAEMEVSLMGLPAGVYRVQAYMKSGTAVSASVVKE